MNACKTKVSGLLPVSWIICDTVLFVVVLVTTLSPTPPAVLCSLKDCSPRGSSVHGILQAIILEWVAISDPGIEPLSPAFQADSLPWSCLICACVSLCALMHLRLPFIFLFGLSESIFHLNSKGLKV